MLRICLPILAATVFALGGACFAKTEFNVDLFCGWGGCYRPMEWTPVEIGIGSNLKEHFGGSVILSSQQDGLNTINITHEFVLTPDVPLHLPLVTRLAFNTDECGLRIINDRGRTCWQHDFNLWNLPGQSGRLTVVTEKDLLVGSVGRRSFGLSRLSKQSVCKSVSNDRQIVFGKVHVQEKLARMAPWDWTGYSSLDLLILYDPHWDLLNRHQFKAIVEWVSNGGKLLLVLGSRPLPAENPIAGLLPFEVGQAQKMTIEPEVLQRWDLNSSEAETVTCWPLKPRSEARVCRSETLVSGECLFGTGCAGFGRVAILAFDPFTFSDKQKARSAQFWANRIAAALADDQISPTSGAEQVAVPTPTKFKTQCPLTGDLTHPDRHDGGIELSIGGLEPGRYQMTSYHNNPFNRHTNIDIYVDGVILSRNNVQSSVTDDQQASQAVVEFTVEGSNDVLIQFRPVASSLNQRAVLCGFDLVRLDGRTMARVLGVDIGALGQVVADNYIGVGIPEGVRRSNLSFDQSYGLPSGVSLTLKATNTEDDLQFNLAPEMPERRRVRRGFSASGFPLSRTIEFVENAEDQDYDRRDERRYRISRAQDGSNAVMEEHLYSISEMRPLSIWWVILLLTTLALLLGPVDYNVLKRLGRLPLTWLTCAFWIALFTAGAYYGVQELRGGKMKLRTVSVADAIAGDSSRWSTTYMGFYAPRSADYRLDGLQDDQWWCAMAPTDQSIYMHRSQTATRNIYCYQHDGGNLPYSLPVNIWTVQCLLNESPLEQMPFTAEVQDNGDELIVRVQNLSDSPIAKGQVLLGAESVLEFGEVAAKSNKQFRDQPRRRGTWTERDIKYYAAGFKCERAFFAQGSLQRTEGIRAYLAHGAAVVSVQYDNAPLPFTVKDHSFDYDYVQLARLVVFPVESVSGGH
jgi:hypothetical protein